MDQARELVDRSPVSLTQQQQRQAVTPITSGRSVTNVNTSSSSSSSSQRYVSSTSTYLQYQRPQRSPPSAQKTPAASSPRQVSSSGYGGGGRSPSRRSPPAATAAAGVAVRATHSGRKAMAVTFGDGVADLFDRHHVSSTP